DNFYGGVRVAVGDTQGVGHDEIITGAGPGGGPHVKVFDGQTGALVQSFFAYDPSFTGGVYVAAGNYEGPNGRHADILTGPGLSGGPNVKVFNGQNPAVVLESFMAFPLAVTTVGLGGFPQYAGVGSVAFDGSRNNNGSLDIVVGSGVGQPAET